MLGEDERRQALVGWNATRGGILENCLHDLFADQAARTPDAAALRFAGRRIDYRTLEKRANSSLRGVCAASASDPIRS